MDLVAVTIVLVIVLGHPSNKLVGLNRILFCFNNSSQITKDISHLQVPVRPNATRLMKNCIGPEWDLIPQPAVYMAAARTN